MQQKKSVNSDLDSLDCYILSACQFITMSFPHIEQLTTETGRLICCSVSVLICLVSLATENGMINRAGGACSGGVGQSNQGDHKVTL